MNKKFVLALMLASGMAFAQAGGSSPGSSDQQQPSTQQPQQPTSQSPTSAGQSTMTGCLKGSDSGWVLVAEGQSTPVTGDSSTLSPHNGHQVQVKGSQASDGSFQVTEVVMIAETCSKQEASSSGGATGAAADASQGAASAAQTATAPKTYSDETPSQSTSQAPSQSTSQPAGAGQKLPQSASPLPLVGLLGVGSLLFGLIVRRK